MDKDIGTGAFCATQTFSGREGERVLCGAEAVRQRLESSRGNEAIWGDGRHDERADRTVKKYLTKR